MTSRSFTILAALAVAAMFAALPFAATFDSDVFTYGFSDLFFDSEIVQTAAVYT